MTGQTSYLERILRPLEGYYSDPMYEEIAINRPKEIWLRLRKPQNGQTWLRSADDQLTYEYLLSVTHAIANLFDKPFHPADTKKPSSLHAALPPYDHRFAAVVGNAVEYDTSTPEGGIAMCIRQGDAMHKVTLDYSAWGMTEGKGVAINNLSAIDLTDPRSDAIQAIRDAIAAGMHLMVSGATSTGKTRFLNTLLNELSPQKRILTVEDVREIRLPNHPNHVHLMLNRDQASLGFTYSNAIDVITRFTPDIVLFSEVSTSNAAALWSLTGSGHGSMMCTIHSSSPEEAYKTMADRILTAKPSGMDPVELVNALKERFCVIQLERDFANNRRLTAVHPPIAAPQHELGGIII